MNDPGFSLTFCMKESNNNNNNNNNKATEYNIIYPVRLDIVFVFCTGVKVSMVLLSFCLKKNNNNKNRK